MPNARQASPIPRTHSANCHMISGCSGLPKLRQSVMAIGSPPTQAMLRAHSATACRAPRRGSRKHQRALAPTESASPLRAWRASPVASRTTAASPPGRTAPTSRTMWSYWR